MKIGNLSSLFILITLFFLSSSVNAISDLYRRNKEQISCPKGTMGILYHPKRNGGVLYIHEDKNLTKTRSPDIRWSDFMQDKEFSELIPIWQNGLKKVKPNSTLMVVFLDKEFDENGAPTPFRLYFTKLVLLENKLLSKEIKNPLYMCLREDKEAGGVFFKAETIQELKQ